MPAKPSPLHTNASYLKEALFNPKGILADARRNLKGVKFDTLIGTGLSGALVLPMLARSMRKHFAVVRKPDNSHSSEKVEGVIGSRWIFVDDLIASGETFNRVREEITALSSLSGHNTELVGVYVYYRKKYVPVDRVREIFSI